MKLMMLKVIYSILGLVLLTSVLLYIFDPTAIYVSYGLSVLSSVFCLLVAIISINKHSKEK